MHNVWIADVFALILDWIHSWSVGMLQNSSGQADDESRRAESTELQECFELRKMIFAVFRNVVSQLSREVYSSVDLTSVRRPPEKMRSLTKRPTLMRSGAQWQEHATHKHPAVQQPAGHIFTGALMQRSILLDMSRVFIPDPDGHWLHAWLQFFSLMFINTVELKWRQTKWKIRTSACMLIY